MNIQNAETKDQLIKRLGRIEGQLRGLQAMLETERDCREIMQQLTAASSALQSASRVFLQDYAALCLAEMDAVERTEPAPELQARRAALVKEMVALLGKTP